MFDGWLCTFLRHEKGSVDMAKAILIMEMPGQCTGA